MPNAEREQRPFLKGMHMKQWMREGMRGLAAIAAGALLAGCAGVVPKEGREETTYYYANRGDSAVAQVVAPPAPPAGKGPVGVLKIVYFDFDQSIIKPEYREVVAAHAEYLKRNRNSQVMLEGHTDVRGGREYNIGLGQRRAEAVRRALGALGVSDGQMEPVSWGKERLASAAQTEEGHQLNRRVEFNYR